MTGATNTVDGLTVTVHGPSTAPDQFVPMQSLYAEEYAQSDDWDNDWEMQNFTLGWPNRHTAPDFRLVTAHYAGDLVGFAFGHALSGQTRWWDGRLEQFPDDVITERPGRTFAIIELIVQEKMRRKGIARSLHAHLTAELSHERITLLVRTNNRVAREAYIKWGYHVVGKIQPFPPDGPIFDAMLKALGS
jgi:ribosomal protein S18 acetylase RimI-like enzyme